MKKAFAIIIIAFLVLNMILYGLGRISTTLFWIIIGLAGIAVWVMKKLS